MTTKPLDVTKPVMFRNSPNLEVRFLGRVEAKIAPLVFAYKYKNGLEYVTQRPENGQSYASRQNPHDVINIPPKPVVMYYEVYLDTLMHTGRRRLTLEEAKESAVDNTSTACVLKISKIEGKISDVAVVHVYHKETVDGSSTPASDPE